MATWQRAVVVRVDSGSSASVVLRAGCHEAVGGMRLRVCNVKGRRLHHHPGLFSQKVAERRPQATELTEWGVVGVGGGSVEGSTRGAA